MTFEEITRVALALEERERARLVESLLRSLRRRDQPAFANSVIEASWLRVARERGREIEEGEVEAVDAVEAFSRLRREYGNS